MKTRSKTCYFAAAVSLLSFFSFSNSRAYVGSVSAATGDAGKAAVEASEAPFSNPATLAFLSGYYFSAGYGQTRQTNQGLLQDMGVSITDNMRETVVPTSLSYSQEAKDEAQQRQFKLSFGNFIGQKVAFGLAIQHQNDRLPTTSYGQTNAQTAFLWAPNANIGFATVFDNLVPPSQEVPESLRLRQQATLAATLNYRRFVRVKLDVTTDSHYGLQRPMAGAGIESYLNDWLILRWGVLHDAEKKADKYTAGFGFIGPKFGFHYAYQNSPQDLSLDRHSVDLVVPIW